VTMIFLINEERVVAEVLELARLKISGILGVKPDDVEATVEVKDGRIRPNFNLRIASDKKFEVAFVQRTMAAVWQEEIKPELVARLRGLTEGRYGFEKAAPEKETAEEETSEEASAEEGSGSEIEAERGTEGE